MPLSIIVAVAESQAFIRNEYHY